MTNFLLFGISVILVTVSCGVAVIMMETTPVTSTEAMTETTTENTPETTTRFPYDIATNTKIVTPTTTDIHTTTPVATTDDDNNQEFNPCEGQAFYPHPLNCSLFYHCPHNKPVLYACNNGTEWNVKTNRCECPESAQCSVCPDDGGIEIPTAPPIGPTTSPNTPCSELFISDPTNCSIFYICINGNLIKGICPEGTEWNSAKDMCTSPEEAQCSYKISTTTIATPTPGGGTENCVFPDDTTPYDGGNTHIPGGPTTPTDTDDGNTPGGPSTPAGSDDGSTPRGPTTPTDSDDGSTPGGPSTPAGSDDGSTPRGPSTPDYSDDDECSSSETNGPSPTPSSGTDDGNTPGVSSRTTDPDDEDDCSSSETNGPSPTTPSSVTDEGTTTRGSTKTTDPDDEDECSSSETNGPSPSTPRSVTDDGNNPGGSTTTRDPGDEDECSSTETNGPPPSTPSSDTNEGSIPDGSTTTTNPDDEDECSSTETDGPRPTPSSGPGEGSTPGPTAVTIIIPTGLCNGGKEFYPDLRNCSNFYQCDDNGIAYLRTCPANLHWNRKFDVCDWPWHAGCTEIKPTPTPRTPLPHPPSSPAPVTGLPPSLCRGGRQYYPDLRNCSNFYHCSNGIPYLKTCPGNLQWNRKLDVCDWPWRAKCIPIKPKTTTAEPIFTDKVTEPNTRAPPLIKTTPAPQPISTKSSNDGYPVPVCKGEQYYPDPTSCTHFYQCSNGRAIRMPCSKGTEWNQELKVCDWPENANCKVYN